MKGFSLGKRVGIIFLDLTLMLLIGLGFYIGLDNFNDYFSFNNHFTFSYFSVFSMFSFLIFTPVIFLSFHPIVYGKQSSLSFQKKSASFLKFGVIFIILSTLVFNGAFLYKVNKLGYIKCKGIPLGSMPGMAAKYAINEKLCLKKSD